MKKLIKKLNIATKLISITTILAITILTIPQAKASTTNLVDISNHTYQTAIEMLYTSGIISGDGGGKHTYRPDDGINRAEITKIIVYSNIDPSQISEDYNTSCFSDIAANEWYTKPICYAKSQGWVQGFLDGTFKASQNVTNFEAMKIVAKGNDIDFNSETDPWYKDLVEKFSNENLIPFTISTPNADLTRGEMADMIVRIQENSKGTLAEYLGSRSAIVVNLDTIDKGLDMTSFTVQTICVNEEECL